MEENKVERKKINNNKLNRKLAETIAGQWQRNKIETVDDAMKLAEKEHKKYKKTTPVITKTTQLKEEKLPEWFDKEIKKVQATREEEDEMATLLSKYQ